MEMHLIGGINETAVSSFMQRRKPYPCSSWLGAVPFVLFEAGSRLSSDRANWIDRNGVAFMEHELQVQAAVAVRHSCGACVYDMIYRSGHRKEEAWISGSEWTPCTVGRANASVYRCAGGREWATQVVNHKEVRWQIF